MVKAEEQLNLQKRKRWEALQWCEVECVWDLRFEVYHPPVPVPRQAKSKYDREVLKYQTGSCTF